jgi:prophage tail gpP-like protein
MSDFQFQLRVNGSEYTSWTKVRLTKSLEQLAHSVSVEMTDRWYEDGRIVYPPAISAGDAFTLAVDGVVLVSGYIDSESIKYSSTNRTITFSGRSKTGDLIDCAAIHGGGLWRSAPLLTIAQDICRPFGITVSVTANATLINNPMRFKLESGETAFNALERAARRRGVMLLTDSSGNLVLDRVSSIRILTALRFGSNILSGSKQSSWTDRFSEYTLKAQTAGGDNVFGKSATELKRSASDTFVTRHRPTVILADNEDSGNELSKRALWERNTRAGRSVRLNYRVQGWAHLEGFWAPNQRVHVVDDQLRIDDELIVASATMQRGEGGTITELSLTAPEAFDVQPLPVKKKKGLFD